jgi:hypothetical protein
MNPFLPSTQMKLQPWAKAFSNFQPELPNRQDALYSFFSSRMMGGSNPVTAALQRIGPIGWTGPISNTKKYKKAIQSWTKVGREMGSRNMNCWEAVYYVAYQAGTMSKNECTKQALFFQGYHKADITALRNHLGAPVPTPRMGDIVVWHSHIIDHVALYLGTAPQSPELNLATGSAEFIWQNSGLSCWGIQQTGCGFTHIAPFQKVKQNTKAPVSFFRPTWWF